MPYLEKETVSSASEMPDPGQNLLDFAVSNSPVIFYIAEVGDVQPLKFISSNVEGITGHKPDMFLQTAGARRNLIHPEDLPAFREAVNGLKSRRPSYEAFSHEYRFRCADGAYLWFRDELTMTTDSSGFCQVIGCMIDVTAEKESQAALKKSEQRFQLIVEEYPLPVFVTDLESGEIIYESPAAAETFGREWRAPVRPPVVAQYADQADRDRFVQMLRRDSAVTDFRLYSRKANGTEFWSTINSRLYQLDGRDIAITSIVDLSEHRQREDDLRMAHETLEDAISALSEGFALFDSDDDLVMCNEQFKMANAVSADLYVPGARRREILKEALARGEFPDARGEEESWLSKRLTQGRTVANDIYMASNGRWFDRRYHPTRQGGFVVTLHDVTEQRNMEQALRDSEALVRRVLDNCPLPVQMVRLDGTILYESPASSALFGRSLNPGDSVLSSYVDPEDRAPYVELLRRTGRVDDYECLRKREDGSTFHASLAARLIEYQGEQVAVSSTIDLTERKSQEAALHGARETLEDAIEALSEGFALYDANDNLVMCNEQFKAFNVLVADLYVPGANRHDILREGVARGQFPAAIGQEEKWLERRRAEGRTNADDYFKTSDGRWFDRSHRPTRQGGLVVTLHDITEQRTVEQTLRDSEAFVRRVLDSCPVPIQMARMDGTGLYESPASGALFGRFLGPGESVLQRYGDPDDRERYIKILRATGRVDDYECTCIRDDGSTFYASVSGRLIEYLGDEVIVSCTIDLTERKKQEAELRRARETLEDAIEALPEGFVLLDSDQKFVMCNQRYREFNKVTEDLLVPGVTRAEFVRCGLERGQYVKSLVSGQTYQYPDPDVDMEALAGQSSEFKQSDGRWFLAANSKTRQGWYVGIRIDITERKKMEEALKESESMFRRVLDACPVPITMYNITNATILYETPAAKKLLGTEAKEGDVRRSSRWADERERDRQLVRLREVGYLDGVEVEFRKADGTIFPVALSARYIGYRGDDVIVTSIFDLSEMRAVEDEMARQRDVLHQSEKLSAIGELLAGVSHELNNPLSVLLGQAILLKDSTTDEAVKARAEKLYSAADRCARIVKTFLALARQRPIEIEATDVNDLIDEALEVTAYSLRSFDIDVLPRLEKRLPNVLADRDQIRQVITNLIINAEHALQDVDRGRQLKIRTGYRKRTNEVVIKVKDNGPGVPADIRSRIFEPLFTTKEVGIGTGIGLALCHRIVEAHGGTIVLESAPGDGATFALRLPADPDAKVEAVRTPDTSPQSGGYEILVIDDEPDVARVLSELLVADGHTTTVALSGEDGLRIVEKKDFDLILCDIRMPKLDGSGFYRAMVQVKPNLVSRLAFVTGDYLSQQALNFLESSGCSHIEKPATPDDLRQLIDELCGDC